MDKDDVLGIKEGSSMGFKNMVEDGHKANVEPV